MSKVPVLYVPPGQRGVAYAVRHLWWNFLGCWPLVLLPAFGVLVSFLPALVSIDGVGKRATQWMLRVWARGLLKGFGVRVWVQGRQHLTPNARTSWSATTAACWTHPP